MSEVDATPQGETADPGEVAKDAIIEDSSPSQADAPETGPKKERRKPADRIKELTTAKYEEQREKEHWRELALSLAQGKAPEEPVTAQPQGKPSIDQFKTYEEYTEAVASWKVQEQMQAMQVQQQQRYEQAQQAQAAAQYRQRADAFAAENEDFEFVAHSDNHPVTDAMGKVIMASENGPAIAYYLGKNPNEAVRIANLPPEIAAYEIGRLEAKVTAPQPRRVTNAPEPMNPLGGAGAAAAQDPMKMSTKDWILQRNREIAARNKR